MSDNTNDSGNVKSNLVDLCGNGCCPKADFSDNNHVTLTDEGQVIILNKDEAIKLVTELLTRGYLD